MWHCVVGFAHGKSRKVLHKTTRPTKQALDAKGLFEGLAAWQTQ